MIFRPLTIMTASLLLLTACANSYDRIETGGTTRTHVRLDQVVPVLVTTPLDGGYGGKLHNGSGAVVARLIDASFSRYAHLVDTYPAAYSSVNDLTALIAKNNYGYIVVPTIAAWKHKDTDWSAVTNQANVKITVIDAATGKEISADFLKAKGPSTSSIYSFLDLDDDGPEELLSNAVDDYVDALYGMASPFALGESRQRH